MNRKGFFKRLLAAAVPALVAKELIAEPEKYTEQWWETQRKNNQAQAIQERQPRIHKGNILLVPIPDELNPEYWYVTDVDDDDVVHCAHLTEAGAVLKLSMWWARTHCKLFGTAMQEHMTKPNSI